MILLLSFLRADAQDDDASRHCELGMDYFARRALNRAEEEFLRCLDLQPDHYAAALHLGRIYALRGKWAPAEDRFRQAVQSDSARVEAHAELADLYRSQWRLREACRELHRVVEIEPDRADAYAKLGSIRMLPASAMDLEDAREAFGHLLSLHPENEWVKSHLALAELKSGRFADAVALCEELAETHPRDFRVHYTLGIARQSLGDWTGATSALKRAIDLRAGSLEATWGLRVAYDRLGGYPDDLDGEYRIETPRGDADIDIRFVDVASEVGAAKTDMGAGCAWADCDGDGDLDLIAIGARARMALYRNEVGEGSPPVFTDIARAAGVDDPRGGFGAIFGDYDNDGDPDLYIIRDGWYGGEPNTLYRNEGDGTFMDVTTVAGVGDAGSAVCAAFGDYDNDGWLDIFVANGVARDGSPNVLYRNNGNGTFTDVTDEAGVDRRGRAVGVASGDYDDDGDLDLYVVYFDAPNVLYRNNGDGTFTDVTDEAGVALPEYGYGTFFFDYDNDGRFDLFISRMSAFGAALRSRVEGRTFDPKERLTLYRNNGDGTFTDVTDEAGLARSFCAISAGFGDVDNDGYTDLYLGNGGVELGEVEPDVLFRNAGDGTFLDVTERTGLGTLDKTRGIAFGDYDGDGDLDLYLATGGAYPGDAQSNRLYRNEGNTNHYLILRLIGTRSNRDGIGAKVRVTTGAFSRYAEVGGGCGFGFTRSLSPEFGLGLYTEADEVEVRWPSGIVDTLRSVEADRIVTVVEGRVK